MRGGGIDGDGINNIQKWLGENEENAFPAISISIDILANPVVLFLRGSDRKDLRLPLEEQLSFQSGEELPEVITFLKPLSRRGFEALHAAHVRKHEPLEDQGELAEWLERYLARSTLAHGEFSPVKSFQFSLSQLTMYILRFSGVEPQRKLRFTRSIS